ncbi:MAG TPA: alpha/beta fold hydrolase [Oscillospiraceae bacterium]|nr:alpha/beta fold hydrolase [Oscillospiraceae bacterium]
MRKIKLLAVLLLFTLLLVACNKDPAPTLPPQEGEIADLANEFVAKLKNEDFTSAVGFFDTVMKKELPVSRLEEVWKTVEEQVGAFQSITETRTEDMGQAEIAIVTARFAQNLLDIRITFNQDKRISGLYFVPAQNQTTAYKTPPYAHPAKLEEIEVTIGEEWALPGTLTIPQGSGPFPAVVLVHGSGPNDRDETIGINGAVKPFKDLAWGLASQGVAVLRYDKRTKVYPDKLAALSNFTVQEETIADALAAVELLSQQKKIDPKKIYVLGHSLGGMLAPRIGAAAEDKLAGLVILAGPTRPLEELILEQTKYLANADGSTTEQEAASIRQLEAQIVNIQDPNLSPSTPPTELFNAPASYWLDLRSYNPAETAKNLNLPMLILQGERDYQVTMTDFAKWQQTIGEQSGVQLKSYPGLNHLFIKGEQPSLPAEYEEPGNVAQEVITDIATWLQK